MARRTKKSTAPKAPLAEVDTSNPPDPDEKPYLVEVKTNCQLHYPWEPFEVWGKAGFALWSDDPLLYWEFEDGRIRDQRNRVRRAPKGKRASPYKNTRARQLYERVGYDKARFFDPAEEVPEVKEPTPAAKRQAERISNLKEKAAIGEDEIPDVPEIDPDPTLDFDD